MSQAGPIAELIGAAKDPAAALRGLVDAASPLEAARAQEADGTSGPRELHVEANVDRDEFFVRSPMRSWRVRGAATEGNAGPGALTVALCVTDNRTGRFHLDSLDLYSARQRAAFVSGATTELHCAAEELICELAEVISAAERARDAEQGGGTRPAVTEAESKAAMALLHDPALLDKVVADLGFLGVVGEKANLALAWLATVSRLSERPFGVMVQSSSAAGKSTLTDAVCSFVPPEDLVSLSAVSPQALYYLGSGALSHKVLQVAEVQGASRATYALKLLLSEGRLVIASAGKDRRSGRLATRSYEVAGPVALLMTTTATEIDHELANRLVVLGVDEDAAQTRAIIEAQREAATIDGLVARARREELRGLHRNTQRLLAPYPVIVPGIDTGFPTSAIRHRRDHAKLLGIVAAVTLAHQHMREKKEVRVAGRVVTYLEATEADVTVGIELGRSVLAASTEPLGPQARRLLEAAEAQLTEKRREAQQAQEPVGVTRRELRERLGWSDKQVRAATDRLVALEYLVVAGGGRGRLRTYSLVDGFGPLRPPDEPLRPEKGRSSHPSPAGHTRDFAHFAQFAGGNGSDRGDVSVNRNVPRDAGVEL